MRINSGAFLSCFPRCFNNDVTASWKPRLIARNLSSSSSQQLYRRSFYRSCRLFEWIRRICDIAYMFLNTIIFEKKLKHVSILKFVSFSVSKTSHKDRTTCTCIYFVSENFYWVKVLVHVKKSEQYLFYFFVSLWFTVYHSDICSDISII